MTNFIPIKQTPACKYFGECGGCKLQDISNNADYKIFKIKDELAKISFKGNFHPLYQIKEHSRRRVNFKVNNQHLCFNKSSSTETVKIADCLLLNDKINNLIEPINKLLKQIKIKIISISITNSDTGIEMLLFSTSNSDFNSEYLLTEFAKKYDIARIAWQINKLRAYTIVQFKPIAIKFDERYVYLPINSFLQVSQESSLYMSQVILENIDKNQSVLELYCGVGSFTIPIAKITKVTAIEGNAHAINALSEAAKTYSLPIIAINKDLYQTPYYYEYINRFSQIVINPPRNGATPQIKQIALAENIKNAVLVSCSLENFIRDSKILLQADFKLKDVYPIDQFLYSEHIEIIGVFVKN